MKDRYVHPLIMWAIVIVGILLLQVLPKKEIIDIEWMRYLLWPCILYFVYFFYNASRIHKQARKSVVKINKIIKSGVYGSVRHPIYSAAIILSYGIFLYLQGLRSLVSVTWMTIVLVGWMRLEEKFLIKKFGNEYKEYMKKVPMFLPRF